MFVLRRCLSLLLLAALALVGHIVWFSNTHRGSDPNIDYWPSYCAMAPVATDACATVLSVAHYFGQYKYNFGRYYPDRDNQVQGQTVRISEYGTRMALPVTPGTLNDPDSATSKARIEACRVKGAEDANPERGGACLDTPLAYRAYFEAACQKVADELQQGLPHNFPSECSEIVGDLKKGTGTENQDEAYRQSARDGLKRLIEKSAPGVAR